MSNFHVDAYQYAQPEIENKPSTIYTFNELKPLQTNSNINKEGNFSQL